MAKIPFHFLSFLICAAMCACSSSSTRAQEPAASQNAEAEAGQAANAPARARQVSMAFTGDVMMGTNFPNASTCTKDGGKSIFQDCKEYMRSADLCIINLEGTCYDGPNSDCAKRYTPGSTTCYIFRMPADHVQNLVDAGVDACNFANNHSNDFGINGRKGTIKNVRDHGIEITGIKDLCEGCFIERQGLRIGIVTFAASCSGTNNLNDYAEVRALMKKYRDSSDILVVGFHGGGEGSKFQHVTKQREFCFGENRGNVMEFAHICIDNGADIVVGHGPHVPRAIENYKGHLIAYSLGNFAAPYMVNLLGPGGQAPLLEVVLNEDGSFASGKIRSFIEKAGVGPRADPANACVKNMKALTKADFPDTPLEITDEGDIIFK